MLGLMQQRMAYLKIGNHKFSLAVNYHIYPKLSTTLTPYHTCPKLECPFYCLLMCLKLLGPVVQSVVSLTSSLRVISLTVLADSMYNILKFFAEKM